MKFAFRTISFFLVICASVHGFSLDREAFSVRNYDLKLQVDPEQHRLGARGRITLRNDTKTPQTVAVLQISSSLDWRSVRVGDRAVQVVRQPYASDIDHTGALSEAIVTLPQAVAPQGTVDLTIAYEGVITLDATRLTRIGTPQDAAESTDWDRIDAKFSAVRGAGYVAWYPIATEVANLSEGDSLFEVLSRWRTREAGANMDMFFESTLDSPILLNGTPVGFVVMEPDEHIVKAADSDVDDTSWDVPTFAIANFKTIDVKPFSKIAFLPGREGAAESYRSLMQDLSPLPSGRGAQGIEVVELPYADAAPFWAGEVLLMPLKSSPTSGDRLTLLYALARRGRRSPRLWIGEGLAHYAQVRDLEQQHGRQAALDYLKSHLHALVDFEQEQSDASDNPTRNAPQRPLINMTDEVSMQSKAMWVWWMLRDMLGEVPFNFAVSRYRNLEDKDPAYMQKLLEGPARPDLQWFFDDWVYHDHGLPDFKVESAFSAKTTTGSFIVTVTVDNLGGAGAEVPVIVKFAGGESTKRLEVRGKNRATIRVEVPAAPQEIVVNDGSVPESDLSNNLFKIEAAEKH